MKNKQKIIDEVNKCSRCALCFSVCPLYQATKDETKSAKGFFNIIYGILTGKIRLKKNIDLICLNCNKCKTFCPSDINFNKVLPLFKYNYKLSNFNPFIFKIKLYVFSFIIKLYKIFNLKKYFKNSLFAQLSVNDIKIDKSIKYIPKNKKIIFFEGCFNRFINSDSKNAILNLLSKNGYEVIIRNLGCCNINSYFEGDFNYFKKSWEKKLKKISKDVDYILSDCDTCFQSFNLYINEFENKCNLKCLTFIQFIEKYNLEFCQNKNYENIVYHKPCKANENNYNILKSKVENLKYIDNFEKCCGFGSLYGIIRGRTSKQISENKFKDVEINSINTIITSCNLCRIGLFQGLIVKKKNTNNENIKVINVSEIF